MNFGVTPEELNIISKSLVGISEEFLIEVSNMYNTLNELNSKWQGQGSEQYYQIINSKRSDVEAIGKIIGQYGLFLNKAAIAYSETDSDIASSAQRM